MKKVWNSIAKDLWIVLLDIIAVNAAFFLALLLRFYVNFQFRPTVNYLIGDWAKFAPFYTVLAIIIFAAFKLYGGMWRYAGINDMNRIIGASLCTALLQIVGTALFIRRMPITYYIIGAILQFLFITLIRFGYRILLVEKRRIALRKAPIVPAMIIGAGETARKAIKHLEDTPFRATVAVDEKSAGKSLDGVPIIADMDKELSTVQAAFIADPALSTEKRNEIKEKCNAAGIEVQDFTGYLSNLSGKIPLTSLLEVAKGPIKVVIDGTEKVFASGEEARNQLTERYNVEEIEGMIVSLKKVEQSSYIGYETWARQYREETGQDISFF